MATIKSRKITKIVREFIKAGDSYDITGINLGLAKYLWRETQETFIDLATGDYRIDQSNGKQTLVILNAELLAQAEAFQVGYVLDFTASEYDTEWNVDINQLKEKYNTLVQNTQSLWEYVRLTGFIADDTTINLILPQLDDNQFWFYQDGKYKAYDVSDFRQLGESLIEAYAEYQKSVIELMVRNARENIQNNVNNGAVSIQNLLNSLNLNVENFTGDKKLELQKIINDFRKELEIVSVGNANTVQGYVPANFDRVENTIKDLQNSKKYKVGDVIEVLGYYTAGDGSHHKRIAKATDDGSGEQGQNGIWWCVLPSEKVRANCFGLKDTGYNVNDETNIIQRYVDFCFNNKIKCVFNFKNTWISDTIYLKGDVDGTLGRFVMPSVDKPAFYIDSSLQKIDGLYVDFYGGDSLDKKNRYLLLCDKVDRREIIGLKQFRGYGVIKMVEESDIDLVKNDTTKQQITAGTYQNHLFSNTIEILSATRLKGIGLNLVATRGGSTGNFYPNVYMNRQENDDSTVEMIKMVSCGGGHVFGQLNLEWFNFSGGAISLNDSEMVINELYFEGAVCKGQYTGFINQYFKSDFVCKKIQFINCNTDHNTSIVAVNQDGNVNIDNIHIAGYQPFKDWNNNRVECVYFKTNNTPFDSANGTVSIGNVHKRTEQLINADNVCYNNGTYLYSDYEGLNNNPSKGIVHPLKKLGNKMCAPYFYGTLKSDNSTFKKIGKSQFSTIIYDNNLMAGDQFFVIPETGIYEVAMKANFGFGSRATKGNLEVFISQGGGDEKSTKTFVSNFSRGDVLTLENIGNDAVLKPNFYGFVSIRKIY